MSIRNSSTRWGSLSQMLHWLIVAMICVQVTLALTAKELHPGHTRLALIGYHKSIGATILALAVIRLVWRWMNPVPALPDSLKPYEKGLARFTHAALYVILFAMPLSGWIGSSAHAFPVRWFNLFTLPALVGKNLVLSSDMGKVHYAFAILLGAVVVLHIAAALKHHFVLKDGTLLRMLPVGKAAHPHEMSSREPAKRTPGV